MIVIHRDTDEFLLLESQRLRSMTPHVCLCTIFFVFINISTQKQPTSYSIVRKACDASLIFIEVG